VIAMAGVAGYVGICVIVFAIIRLAGLDIRSFLIPLTFGNTGNLGLPLALFAFGNKVLVWHLDYLPHLEFLALPSVFG